MRKYFIIGSVTILAVVFILGQLWPFAYWSLVFFLPIILLGLRDMYQKGHSVLRNFPVIGHFRYLLEMIRPEIQQYFIEQSMEGTPYSREIRSVIYQRAKGVLDTLPFGTEHNVYETGYEWVNHSLAPIHVDADTLREVVGGKDCSQPYASSILNISGMSYGALSGNAILALSQGARIGGFAHNTGEGGISHFHLEGGADLIWQIGTGYFGCRTMDGRFCPDMFTDNARLANVKMIEIKLSQGAKPGHGGILPKEKISPEISKIRGIPMGQDCLSPPAHSSFSTPIELLQFVANLRELSGGKPVGFKLCLGKRREFLAICKAMLQTGILPDFITVDGGEGGTGAAPLEFSNNIGCPAREALVFVHNSLVGAGLRGKIKVIASGKVATGFDVVNRCAIGANICHVARPMMMAVGCIQAQKCNNNECPVGVATQDPNFTVGLVPSQKKHRVARYHKGTVMSAAEMIGAMGVAHTKDLRPWHIMRRVGPTEIMHYGELYHYFKGGELLEKDLPPAFKRAWEAAQAESFFHTSDDPHVQRKDLNINMKAPTSTSFSFADELDTGA